MERFSQSPTDRSFIQSPYPSYDAMRARGRLIWWEDYNLPMASHYSDVATLLRDRRLGRTPPEPMRYPPEHAPFFELEAHSMLELEPPRHRHLRAQVLRAFTSRAIAALERPITALCRDLITGFPAGPFDLISAYAQPLPARIIARFMGLPQSDAPRLVAWSNAMVKMYQAGRSAAETTQAVEASRAFTDYLRKHIADKRQRPAEDLISTLATNSALTERELISTCVLLLNAGHEATVHTLGNAVKTLLEQDLRPPQDPEAMPAFVEEVLRHDPPLHLFTRWVNAPLDVGPHRLEPGSQVGLLLAAANRDPAAFSKPSDFDMARKAPPAALSFGAGLHFCIGAPLARMEIGIALSQLFARCPRLTLRETPRYAGL